MSGCYLHGHGKCGGGISREHYVSRSMLSFLAKDGTIAIGGLPWQPKDTIQVFGIDRLLSKVLCQSHNNNLSFLDEEGAKLFCAFEAVDKAPNTIPDLTVVDGRHVERLLLKVICGLSAGQGFNNGLVPSNWAKLLLGQKWPAAWGLYAPELFEPVVMASEIFIEAKTKPSTGEVLALFFGVAGVHLHLLLGNPDNPSAWGVHRPRGFIFRNGSAEKRVEFDWPFATERAMIYTHTGATTAEVPQWQGWIG